MFVHFFPTFNKYELYKNIFSRPNLKERMSFRDGIIFKITSPHTEKIYIGCSSLPLKRAVSGLRASAKFRKLSCNILFQAGDIESEVLAKFQDITILEMRKKWIPGERKRNRKEQFYLQINEV